MKPILTHGTALAAALLASAVASGARGDDAAPHPLGHHPAVVVQRLYKAAGYDYASKFYPHPAWLHLYAEPPNDLMGTTPMAGTDPTGDRWQADMRQCTTGRPGLHWHSIPRGALTCRSVLHR